eukprot:232378-Rhodomonas_salina.1
MKSGIGLGIRNFFRLAHRKKFKNSNSAGQMAVVLVIMSQFRDVDYNTYRGCVQRPAFLTVPGYWHYCLMAPTIGTS